MPTVTATARCLGGCGWTAGPGDWAATDRAAEKHAGPGHPTATTATATTTTTTAKPMDVTDSLSVTSGATRTR